MNEIIERLRAKSFGHFYEAGNTHGSVEGEIEVVPLSDVLAAIDALRKRARNQIAITFESFGEDYDNPIDPRRHERLMESLRDTLAALDADVHAPDTLYGLPDGTALAGPLTSRETRIYKTFTTQMREQNAAIARWGLDNQDDSLIVLCGQTRGGCFCGAHLASVEDVPPAPEDQPPCARCTQGKPQRFAPGEWMHSYGLTGEIERCAASSVHEQCYIAEHAPAEEKK